MQRFLTARKQYIERQFANLNPMQRQAVLSTEGPLLLLAGAGSGKTTVLINRVANLLRFGRGSDSNEIPDTISDEDVLFLESLTESVEPNDAFRADYLCAVEPPRPWNVLVITFTNKAANELKERLAGMLGENAQDVWAMTFHSACCRILRREIERIGFTRSFTIYDQSDSERVMKNIIQDLGLDEKTLPAKYVLSIISREKDRMVSPEEMHDNMTSANDFRMRYVAKAYKMYQAKLQENNALDFDDIIYKTVQLLRDHEDIRIQYQQKFRYVLVDEYQDTNRMQYMLTALLAGGFENICVVGDDDQSIYRFRGATIENILDFEKQYHGSRTIRLEQNYRSTQSILNAANSVIAHNLGRKGKRLWTENTIGNPITVYEALDQNDEARYITQTMLRCVETKSSSDCYNRKYKDFSEFAVLYRNRALGRAIEQELRRNGIPCVLFRDMSFFSQAEIKDMMSYLWVINNRADDLRLDRIINNPPRGIGAKTIETAKRLANAEHVSLYSVISNPDGYAPLEKSAKKLKMFSTMIERLSNMLDSGMSLPDFYDALLLESGYVEMLKNKPTEENKSRLESIYELKTDIINYANNTDSPNLGGYLELNALMTELDTKEDADKAAYLMTMHAAKGLEFSHVFIAGFEEGIFPGVQAIGDMDEMEEERRLCYVAITRAKKSLTISYARQRMLYGKTSASLPSRFLREIPENLTIKKGGYVQNSYKQPQTVLHQPSRFEYAKSSISIPTKTPTMIDYNKGDMVQHTAFGRGMVLSVIKMGNDALLEIAFDQIGTKKLMAKTASAHLKRL